MNKTDLKEVAGISFNVMARMGKMRLFPLTALKRGDGAVRDFIEYIVEINDA